MMNTGMDDEEPTEGDADIKNDNWLKENYVGLVQEFPNQWIAVMDQDVLCSGISKASVVAKAKKLAGGRTISIYFIEPSPLPL